MYRRTLGKAGSGAERPSPTSTVDKASTTSTSGERIRSRRTSLPSSVCAADHGDFGDMIAGMVAGGEPMRRLPQRGRRGDGQETVDDGDGSARA